MWASRCNGRGERCTGHVMYDSVVVCVGAICGGIYKSESVEEG
jgi:hypothetical protein